MIQQHKTNTHRQLRNCVLEVRIFLAVINHRPKFHSFSDQQSGLVQHPMLQAYGQGGVALRVLNIVVDVSIKKIENGEEEVLFAGVVQWSFVIAVHNIKIDFLAVQQGLQNLDLVVRSLLSSSILVSDFDETVEDRGAPKLIQAVDFNSILQQFLAYFGRRVKVGGIGNKVMQGVPVIQIPNISRRSMFAQDAFNIVDCEFLFVFYYLNNGNLVQQIAVINGAPIHAKQVHVLQLPIQCSVQKRSRTVDVKDVRCQSIFQQIFKTAMAVIVRTKTEVNMRHRGHVDFMGVEQRALPIPHTEKMQRCSTLAVLRIEELINPFHKSLKEYQRGESHEEMLDTPFFVILTFVFEAWLVHDTARICPMFDQKTYQFQQGALMLNVQVECPLNALFLCCRSVSLGFWQLLHQQNIVFPKVGVHSLCKIFHQKDNELKSKAVSFAQFHFQNFVISLGQLGEHKLNLLLPLAGNVGQIVHEIIVFCCRLDVKWNFLQQQLNANEIFILYAIVYRFLLLFCADLRVCSILQQLLDQSFLHILVLVWSQDRTFTFTLLQVLLLPQRAQQMQAGVSHVGVLVVQLVDVALQQVLDHGEKLGSASRVLQQQKYQMMMVWELFQLQKLSAVIMALQHGYFPRIEVFLVWDLVHHFAKVHHQLDVSIGRSVVQQSIIAVVSLESALGFFQEVKENVVVVITQGHYQRASSEVIKSAFNAFRKDQVDQDLGSSTCCQMQNCKLFLSFLVSINKRVFQKQRNTLFMTFNNCVMQSSEALITFVIDIFLVPHLLQDELDVCIAAELSSHHQRSHFFLIHLSELICVVFVQNFQSFKGLQGSCIVNGLPVQ